MLGGYAQLGRASFLRKNVTGLCSHNEVWLSFQLVAIDGWNGEDAILYADGVEVWRRPFSDGGHRSLSCGGSDYEDSISGSVVISHSARTLALELRTTLSAEADVISWGLKSFTVLGDCAGDSAAACAPIVACAAPAMDSLAQDTCVLTLGGVECWGLSKNYFAQTSFGMGVAVAVGSMYIVVVRSDGSLEGYGRNNYHGQLGDDFISGNKGRTKIDIGGLKAVAVSAHAHTVVLMEDGSVRAFGYNGYGQLGLGDTDNRGDGPGEMGANLPPVPQTLIGQTHCFRGSPDLHWARLLDGFAPKIRLSTW